ncbi:methylmalonyl-CoA mutase family protein [Bacillus sp. FJAT-27986]|uniref:methylmalonyl-CoA mutase family protein n=1 Tax=Bacillus sp. FJAT-27986 TaxID=1743146 RepID=UPI00080AF55D|nr:methylmalonyl-CoA mutase family protein [Bacillus sp. FJAT-27986]OCA86313.1 hypothetical protein A8L44_07850 [Bacillus sp. FJAT-27986]
MKIKDAKNDRFQQTTVEEWEKAVLKSLKGKELDTLHTQTFEKIILKPLYNLDSEKDEVPVPGKPPYTRGIYENGYQHHPLKICQVATGSNIKGTILEALENGQNTISFDVNKMGSEELIKLLNDLPIEDYPLFLQAGSGNRQEIIMEKLAEVNGLSDQQGAVVRDLITEWAERGSIPTKENNALSDWFHYIKNWNLSSPTIKTILVNSRPYHEAGADAVKEIAYSLSLGAHYVFEGMQAGLSAQETAEKIIFSFSIDSSFFMQIAKLRAARKLWFAVGKSYGQENNFKMDIHAQTSLRNKTGFDHYVNLLRSTNEALAAVIGNCQYLTVIPFDQLQREKSSLGKRLARNIPHILREESMLMKTADPGGGSYYLEALTDELCQQAWDQFIKLEKKGGILSELKKGQIQGELTELAKNRLSAVAIRKEKMVGTNVYANPKEERPDLAQNLIETQSIQKSEKEIFPLKPIRLASEFEAIRSMNLTWGNEMEQRQRIIVIGLGSVSQSKPYIDLSKEVLAAGGLSYTERTGIVNQEMLEEIIRGCQGSYFLICGDENHLNTPLSNLKVDSNMHIYAVGNFDLAIKEFNWKKIDRHTNMIDLLTILSSRQGVKA